MVKTKKYFKYSVRQCCQDVEIHKANGQAAAPQADTTTKTFFGKTSTTKPDPHHYQHWWMG